MRYLSIFLLLSLTTAFASEVYFSRDKNGNVVFSDRPSANSEIHTVKDIPTVPAFVAQTAQEQPKDNQQPIAEYTTLTIVAPANELTIPTGHTGNITVSGVLSPGLRSTDTIYLLDHQTIIQQGRKTTFKLSNLPRGEHKFQLVVRDNKGKDLISSNTVTVYVQRASILKR